MSANRTHGTDGANGTDGLPSNIRRDHHGYLVRVQRGRMKFRGFVPYTKPDALQHAMRLRDEFLAAIATVPLRHKTGRSNTGIPGISEMVKWRHGKPTDCFNVYLGPKCRPQMKLVFYGPFRPREVALRKAVALRRAAGAEIPDTAIPQPLF